MGAPRTSLRKEEAAEEGVVEAEMNAMSHPPAGFRFVREESERRVPSAHSFVESLALSLKPKLEMSEVGNAPKRCDDNLER